MSGRRQAMHAILVALLAAGGCVTTRPDGEPVPDTALDMQPAEIVPYAVSLLVVPAVDSDADGQIDAIPVVAHLMARAQGRDALAVWVDGHLEFSLIDDGGDVLAHWAFSDQETQATRIRTQVGRAYRLALRLQDAQGVPEGESRAGSLSCRFVPKVGEPIESRTFVTVLVGGAGWEHVP